MRILRWFLYLPPIDKRPRLNSFVRNLVVGEYDRAIDDTYLFWKLFVVNLWMNSIFISAYLISFLTKTTIKLGPIEFEYLPATPIDGLIYGYPSRIFPILMVVTAVYALLLFTLRSDYFSKQRIATELVPAYWTNKKLYDDKPHSYILLFAFLIVTGPLLWNARDYLRGYETYNFIHDFRGHGIDNFIIFAAVYLLFYQTFYVQMTAFGLINFLRSILRHYVYREHIDTISKENNNDND